MTIPASDALMSELSDCIGRHLGLQFPRERWGDLERSIRQIAHASGTPDIASMVRRLSSSPVTREQSELLASHLTVGETYFLREPRSLEAFQDRILPELLRTRGNTGRQIRIWSAGCCTGEEPYSIAMLLDQLMPRLQDWSVTLLATDINPLFLRKAAAGIYGKWSFRNTPASLREIYFQKQKDGRYQIKPHIRRMVNFSSLNLVGEEYPSPGTEAMDVIFCRNVLMYFTATQAARVIAALYRCLVDGGWLITSPAETSAALFSSFEAVNFPGAVVYRKVVRAGYSPVPDQSPPIREQRPEEPQAEFAAVEHVAWEIPVRQDVAPESETAVQIARACAGEGRLVEAEESCQRAIAADKLNAAHYYLLANIRQEQGHIDTAVQALRHALYLDPEFALAHFSLGNVNLARGRPREAKRNFDNVLALLRSRPKDEVLADCDGLTAGRLVEIIAALQPGELVSTATSSKARKTE